MFIKTLPVIVAIGLATSATAQGKLEGAMDREPAAQPIVVATNPQSFVDFFIEAGFPARLETDGVGDPLVEYRSNGDKQSLYFYDCTDNVDCQAVQFYAGYNTEDTVDLSMINAWNSERRFVRAYLTEENVSRIEMDVATSDDGMSHRDFEALLDLWLDSVVLFEDHIHW